MRVLDQLSKIPETKRKGLRSTPETAHIAKAKLETLVKNGARLDDLYKQYDVNKSGKISYKDFSDTLLAVSAGLTREETHQLAATLDKNRVGSVEYGSILSALNNLQSQQNEPRHASDAMTTGSGSERNTSSAAKMSLPPPLPAEQPTLRTEGEHMLLQLQLPSPEPEQHSSRVMPRTSFAYVGSGVASEEGSSAGASSDWSSAPSQTPAALPPAPHQLSIELPDNTAPPRPPSDHHSPTYSPPRKELDARSVIARRFFHNPNVNTIVYGDTAQVVPYDFDRSNPSSPQPVNRSRRRAVSAPGRARASNLRDSGCNLSPADPQPSPYEGILRKSPTSTMELTVDEAALAAKLHANPFFKADERVAAHKEAVRAQEKRTLETAVADQIGGGVTRLKKLLQQHDASGSGMLNTEEFKFALKKLGVNLSRAQYDELYNQSARPVAETSIHGYNRGQAVDIEAFTNRIQEAVVNAPLPSSPVSKARAATRASTGAEAAQAKFGGTRVYGEEARQLEKVRVMKKVLQSAAKLPNPHAVYNHIEPRNNGYLHPRQLQDALLHMGANLSATEFNVLMRSVPKDPEGKIELSSFEHVLRDEVGHFEKANASQAEAQRRSYGHYSRSFRTSDDFSLAHQHLEFQPLCHRRGQAEETETSRRWGQLQDIFQRNPDVVMHAFSVPKRASPERRSLRPRPEKTVELDRHSLKSIPLRELKERLSSSGLALSEDDVVRVERTLARRAGAGSEGGEVSLQNFCEAVGLEVKVKDKDHIGEI
jgi:Ca2+-binding EF-hand superfamily protein